MNKYTCLFLLIFMVTTLDKSVAQSLKMQQFNWKTIEPIPDKIGFAGSFAGVANDCLFVAGGANFPDGGAPWTGSVKAWSDQIFILEKPKGEWKIAGTLPQKMGYGVSINYKDDLILLGGSNEQGHLADVVKINYKKGKLSITPLPSLPQPIANTCGVLVGDVVYVLGGIVTADAKTAATNFLALDLSAEKMEWKVLPTWPGEGRMLSVAGSLNGAIYLFSGVALENGQRKYLKDAYQYLPANGWKKIADLPNSVAAAPTPAFNFGEKKMMIFGGDDGIAAPNAANLKDKHPGFSDKILSYNPLTNVWEIDGNVFTNKKAEAVTDPNQSIWAPVTTTLTVWKGNVILPGGEVRPATRTPNVLLAKPIYK